MNLQDMIREIDAIIKYLNSQFNEIVNDADDVKRRGEAIKNSVLKSLQQIGCNKTVIFAIKNVSFDSQYGSEFSVRIFGYKASCEGLERSYKQGVEMIINILRQERESLFQTLHDEEQKAYNKVQKINYKIQIYTLICSAIAAIGGIISLFITIFS